MLNLKQLFPALKLSLLKFLTASCVFCNTFLCLHSLPFRFYFGALVTFAFRQIQMGTEVRIFGTEDQNKKVFDGTSEEHIPKQTSDLFHFRKDIFQHILYVYTSLTSCIYGLLATSEMVVV